MGEDDNRFSRHYRSLFNNSRDGIYRSTPEGEFIDVNFALVEMLGYDSREELLSLNIPEDVYYRKNRRPGPGERDKPFVTRLKKKNGDIIWVEVNSWIVSNEEGKINYYEGIVRDITEYRQTRCRLKNTRGRLKATLNSIGEGVIVTDREGRVDLVNPAAEELTGWKEDEARGRPVEEIFRIVNRNTREPLQNPVLEALETGEAVSIPRNTLLISREGKERIISDSAAPITGEKDYFGGIIVFRDETEKRSMEEKLRRSQKKYRYLGYHDKLTGLYNRAYFEKILEEGEYRNSSPTSIIMGDVNGLKLINDAFGRKEGDKVLKRLASLLQNSCRRDDIIARWGGDEFVILLPETGEEHSQKVVRRIKQSCSRLREDLFQADIALGYATRDSEKEAIQNVLKRAENWMYKRKLVESKSTRSSIISSLEEALWEKNYETREHARRLKKMVVEMGEVLNLPDNKRDELILLSGLHDIGKIAISDSILMKPGSLSEDDWAKMKKHPEIGYRIAESSPELAPIAMGILHHHEWWDGSGYPRGLEGEDIPLISRIISIVDAYDVMLHERPYKEPMGEEEAVEELFRFAGKQFDPELVDIFVDEVLKWDN
ncbi:MAG: diguanylate cyclase domain-containing protein [Bacillota bacterium]